MNDQPLGNLANLRYLLGQPETMLRLDDNCFVVTDGLNGPITYSTGLRQEECDELDLG